MSFRITESEKKEIKSLYNIHESSLEYLDKFLSKIDSIFDTTSSEKETSSTPIDSKFNVIGSDKDFRKYFDLIVDKLEGGYYNPDWHYSSAMGDSGETLYGLDRKHGGKLNETPEGLEFWKIVDENKNKSSWTYNYKPSGSIGEKLKNLASKIIENHYNKLQDKYLSNEAKNIVNSDSPLKGHFIYAAWNGPGFFKNFAEDINNALSNGIKDPQKLRKIAMQSRRNSRVSRSADKVGKLFGLE